MRCSSPRFLAPVGPRFRSMKESVLSRDLKRQSPVYYQQMNTAAAPWGVFVIWTSPYSSCKEAFRLMNVWGPLRKIVNAAETLTAVMVANYVANCPTKNDVERRQHIIDNSSHDQTTSQAVPTTTLTTPDCPLSSHNLPTPLEFYLGDSRGGWNRGLRTRPRLLFSTLRRWRYQKS